MPTHDIIVIGASAGGVEALSKLVAELPRSLRASVFVVLHLSRGRSVLPEILSRAGVLPAIHPNDGDPIEPGRIYVSRPDHHLTLEPGRIRILHGPTENGYRPAVDPLFRSAARHYGPRVVGVILTGALDDGTAGLAAVKEAGGVAVVQDPEEAFASSMPRSARAFVAVDHVLPVRDIGALLARLAGQDVPQIDPADDPHVRAIETDPAPPATALDATDHPGTGFHFTCPECHGTLSEAEERGLVRFRCRVGHVYSPESMLSAQTDAVDRALWVALRSLEERAALTHRLAERARVRNHDRVAKAFADRAAAADEHAVVIRNLMTHRMPLHEAPDADTEPSGAEQPESERIT